MSYAVEHIPQIYQEERLQRSSSSNSGYESFSSSKKRVSELQAHRAVDLPSANKNSAEELDDEFETACNPPSLDHDDGTSHESSRPPTPQNITYLPSIFTNGPSTNRSLDSYQAGEPLPPRQCEIAQEIAIRPDDAVDLDEQSIPGNNTTRNTIPNGRFLTTASSPSHSEMREGDSRSPPSRDHGSSAKYPTVTVSAASGAADSQTSPSGMSDGSQSTEDNTSTASRKQQTSNYEDELEDDGGLKSLIKKNMPCPTAAKAMYKRVFGKLEYVPLQKIHSSEILEPYSLLDALELDFGHYTVTGTEDTSSISESSSSDPSTTGRPSPAQNDQRGSSGSSRKRARTNLTNSLDEVNESQGIIVKRAARPRSNEPRFPLRCPHHAYLPTLFCVQNDTHSKKYRSCMGPGWNNINHLKEHMKRHHRIKQKNNPLQCSDCQETFDNNADLKAHNDNVTCRILCPHCQCECTTRELRKDHFSKEHEEQNDPSPYKEIDDKLHATIKQLLKAYMKEGKNVVDNERDQWIRAHTEKYRMGRPDDTDPRIDLGQWYIIFTQIFPGIKIPEPFYESQAGIPNSEFVEERVVYIFHEMVANHIDIYGHPQSDHEATKNFYVDMLRRTLKIAKQTRLPLGFYTQPNEMAAPTEPMPTLTHLPQPQSNFLMPTASQAPYQALPNQASYQALPNQASYQALQHEAPYRALQNQAPYQTLQNQASYQALQNEALYQALPNQASYQALQNQASYQALPNQASYQALQNEAPYQALSNQAPYQALQNEAPYQALQNQAPYQALPNQAPYQALSNQALPDQAGLGPHNSLNSSWDTLYESSQPFPGNSLDPLRFNTDPVLDNSLSDGSVNSNHPLNDAL